MYSEMSSFGVGLLKMYRAIFLFFMQTENPYPPLASTLLYSLFPPHNVHLHLLLLIPLFFGIQDRPRSTARFKPHEGVVVFGARWLWRLDRLGLLGEAGMQGAW